MKKIIGMATIVAAIILVAYVGYKLGRPVAVNGQPEVLSHDEVQLDAQSVEVEKMVNSQTNGVVILKATAKVAFEK